MRRTKALIAAYCFSLGCLTLHAQSNTFCQVNGQATANAGKLACLLPNLGFPPVTSGPNPISGLTAAIASQAGLVPLASPASGIIYTNDPSLGIPVPSGSDSFGPVLGERGETLRRGKLFVAFTYQHFGFSDIDGVNLKNIPAYFPATVVGRPDLTAYVETSTRVDLKLNQFAVYATYGITNRLDVSVAVPILDVSLSASSTCTNAFIVGIGSVNPGNCFKLSGGGAAAAVQKSSSATGIGDVVFRGKASLWQGEHLRVAAGVDVRVPSGNELNFLGTGATGVRPFVAASLRGRVAPHFDLGYQWNGNSDVASIQGPGVQGKLPDNLSYIAGVDVRAAKVITVSGEYIGQHVFDALREGLQVQPAANFNGVFTQTNSFNANYASVGAKVNPIGHLLLTVNVLFDLDHNGLRNKPAPLAGISYTF
jgi:hypothetical protein